MISDRDGLIELLEQAKEKAKGTLGSMNNGFGAWYADYILADGWIRPPCKVGDTVYVVSQGQGINMRWNVYEGKVVDIHLNRHNELTVRVENGEKFFSYYKPCFIHKTKEEAEKALEGMNNA